MLDLDHLAQVDRQPAAVFPLGEEEVPAGLVFLGGELAIVHDLQIAAFIIAGAIDERELGLARRVVAGRRGNVLEFEAWRRIGLAISLDHDLDLGLGRQPGEQNKQGCHNQPLAESHTYLPFQDWTFGYRPSGRSGESAGAIILLAAENDTKDRRMNDCTHHAPP